MAKFDPASMELPDNINQEAWIEWVEDRKERNKPIRTEKGANRALNKLKKFSHEIQKIMIDRAIEGEWTGIFILPAWQITSELNQNQSFIERHTDRTWRDQISDTSWAEGL